MDTTLDLPAHNLAILGQKVLGLPRRQAVELLQQHQIDSWHKGERISVERYLSLRPDLEGSETAFDLVLGEFIIRQDLGENPLPEEYSRRLPNFGHQIQYLAHLDKPSSKPAKSEATLQLRTPVAPVAVAPASESAFPVGASSTDEAYDTTLRRRLQVMAVIGLIYAFFAFVVFSMLETATPALVQLGRWRWPPLAILVSVCITVLVVLRQPEKTRSSLRLCEIVILGAMALLLGSLRFAALTCAQDQPADFREIVQESELRRSDVEWFLLILVYGVVVPNTARRTAIVAIWLALVPILLTLGLGIFQGHPLPQVAIRTLIITGLLSVDITSIVFGTARITALEREAARARREARELGQYVVGRKLGSGGMGEVFLAEHRMLKRPCAIKLIRPERSADPHFAARFAREAKATAMLRHPHSVQVYDYGSTAEGRLFCVMEYLPGETLEHVVQVNGPLGLPRAIRLVRQICGALAEAHRHGLVHRDVKPGNVIVVPDPSGQGEVAKLLDFGLVGGETFDHTHGRLTLDGQAFGTPAYIAPEQAEAGDCDGRSDLYSLAAMLYFLLSGRPPFEKPTAMQTILAHLRDDPPPLPARPQDIPEEAWSRAEALIHICMSKSPEDRPRDAEALQQLLAAVDA